ncbi:hypothetical protein [Actinomadura alba]|uniref:Uncharacterized protein n=1 Tax=Actinomadura alba TaxID=406431 RepID=A0ABR7LLC8_9ACTN|nr:hypothetical protein [Actinomadura alba]MBC6465483.1 hypothetical protein [Actinomadura alba]
MHARRTWEPPRLYSWTIVAGGDVGALGVTDDHEHALAAVADALRSAPVGARGLVHRTMLSFSRLGYVYEGLVARCRIDPGSGTVVCDDLPRPSSWTRLAPTFTDPPEVLGDAIPPEAIATGLADLQVHHERLEQVSAPVNPSSGTAR